MSKMFWLSCCVVLATCFFQMPTISAGSRVHRVRRIVGGAPAQVPPADDPKVYLRFAGKAAQIKGVLDQPHYVFRGIRYGLKPSGKDRFQVKYIKCNGIIINLLFTNYSVLDNISLKVTLMQHCIRRHVCKQFLVMDESSAVKIVYSSMCLHLIYLMALKDYRLLYGSMVVVLDMDQHHNMEYA